MHFSEKLNELRRRAGLSQAELASACDMPAGTIRNYDQGIREPDWFNLLLLARALGVKAEAFAKCERRKRAPGRPARG